MKRKRLDRDVWWEFNKYKPFPTYYQMRVDIDEFHGLVCLIHMPYGQYHY